MKILKNPPRSEWEQICLRPSSADPLVWQQVENIIQRVRSSGDDALRDLSEEFDHCRPESFVVSDEEIRLASLSLSDSLKQAIRKAAGNIEAFHRAQMPATVQVQTSPGVTCIQKPVPIDRVGLYVPGGTAPLFSTVLMLAIPAKVAGCSETVLCTPARDGKVAPEVLYAASLCSVSRIFKIGGAQAIAAMALGTESVPRVCKIFGPGNRYVTVAKQILGNREVSVDMPAGPSEVMVLADGSANPRYVAADLLSQAEHGPDSQVMLVCTDETIALRVLDEVSLQTETLARGKFIGESLRKSCAIVFDSLQNILDFANTYGPEHLIISMENPWTVAEGVRNAGSVFVGNYSPESAGDYASGTNHTLPTCGWAASCSGVNIDSFLKKITFQELSREGLQGLSDTIIVMARAEGLDAHANAVIQRTAK